QNLASDSTYTFVFNNLQGCDSTWLVEVIGLDSSLNFLTLQACHDETASFNGQNLTSDSTYTFVFNNLQGCDSTWLVEVIGLDSNLNYLNLVVCPGETAAFNGQNLAPDSTYTFLFNNLQGCDSTWVVQVSEHNLPVFDLGADQNICQSSSPSFNLPTGFVGWSWQPASGVDCATCPVVNLQPNLGLNTYEVTAQTAEGCTVADTLGLMVFPDTVYLNLDTSFCAGSVLNILGQNITTDTLLMIFFDGQASCDTLLTVHAVSIAPVEETLVLEACLGDSVLVQGVYLPAGASQTFVYTAASGCDSLVHVNVLQLDTSQTTINLANCHGQAVVWNGQELLPGNTYLFPFSGQNGCDSTVAVQVSALPGPIVSLPSDTLLLLGQTIDLTPAVSGLAPFTYVWQPAGLLSCNTCANPTAMPLADTWYSVTVTDASGCQATDSVQVRVNPECGLYVPNVFRPDDDGINDHFYPFAGDCVREVLYLRVYDRWGELVFERKNFAANTEIMGWDGKFRGDPALPGVYVWVAEFEYLDGSKSVEKGDVTLIN
ncbi:MAG: gliding motility-associated C-terminal domain-containing protein, partial [Saprospiraceae bacterium]|nr:gliding motility-associated C-terminal domain-containing protein [Saprospiraceae bacterium]